MARVGTARQTTNPSRDILVTMVTQIPLRVAAKNRLSMAAVSIDSFVSDRWVVLRITIRNRVQIIKFYKLRVLS